MMSTVPIDASLWSSKLFIQMSGMPGSGKSTLARSLSVSLGAMDFDHDTIRSTVLEHGIPFDKAAKLSYDLGWTLASDTLKQGRSVIMDSPCNYEEAIERGARLARDHGCEYWYVECQVSNMDVLEERLRARVPLRSQRTGLERPPADACGGQGGVPHDAHQIWNKKPCRPMGNLIFADSTLSPGTNRDLIIEQIRSSRIPTRDDMAA